ncbi:MAG: squalene synthase HpnC [Planctomycetia bacterium]|nr:squalene synthase HpnC [Planctomycetia bacterium]
MARHSQDRKALAGQKDPTACHGSALPGCATLAESEAVCRGVARHYENFTVATRLVPRRLRQHLTNVYAFARWSDDLADESPSPSEAARGLAQWRQHLEACFAGNPTHPVFIALAETVRQTGLTIKPFSDLLSAFEEDQAFDQDQIRVRYATRTALLDYCHRSADPVGQIVLALEGCHDPELISMSDAICTGLQLVNFWQDVKRDRLAGRVYLPRDDMDRFGIEETALDASRASPDLIRLLREEVAWAGECFAAGSPLVKRAPLVLQPAIRMFLAGGRAVASCVERAGFDTLSVRPMVSTWTKLRLAAAAWCEITTAPWRSPV